MTKEIDAGLVIMLILKFLQMLMPQTLAKRVLSMVLIATGIPDSRVTELTGLCDRSVRTLRKALELEKQKLFFM